MRHFHLVADPVDVQRDFGVVRFVSALRRLARPDGKLRI